MVRKILFAILFFPIFAQAGTKPSAQEIAVQLLKNAHGGVELQTINGRTSYLFFVGTSYFHYFNKNVYFNPGLDFKWGQYPTFNNEYINTSSLAVPLKVGYTVASDNGVGANFFGGVVYEQILHTSYDSDYSFPINNSQVAVTAGARINLMNTVGFTVSYAYGLIPLYKDGSGRISSFSFSFNF